MNWSKELRNRIVENKILKECSTFKIGGEASYFFEPKNIEDLSLALINCKNKKIPVKIIGAGSNLLIDDLGVNALVIRLASNYFKRIEKKENTLVIGAGVKINKLVGFCASNKIGGYEFLIGIPGTLGGAVIMNAGITLKDDNNKTVNLSIGDLVENVTVMDYNGKVKKILKDKLKFSYRSLNLEKSIILEAELVSKKVNYKIADIVSNNWQRRKSTQDLSWPSCGCVFKNPKNESAGRLIDLCGLKGQKFGQAQVSCKHANFIINLGKASYKDIITLMNIVKKEVKKKFNIVLRPEIKIWKCKK